MRTGATSADAAAEWLRYIEHDRGRKPSTVAGYKVMVRSMLLPAFGDLQLDAVTTPMIECWVGSLELSASTRLKAIVLLHGIFARAKKVWSLSSNPVDDVEKPPLSRSGDIDVFSPEEVYALVRAAASDQDAAIYLTAAFTGLRRGELIALHWRDVDFVGSTIRVRGNYSEGVLTTPKSGKIRAVPMAPGVATALARLCDRENWVGDDDLVFVGVGGSYLDGSALRRRYGAALERAGLRQLRFHDLRHTFGTRMIGKADIRRVQEWMGHSSIQTTMQYLHYAPRSEDARLVAEVPRRGLGGPDIFGHLWTSWDDFVVPRVNLSACPGASVQRGCACWPCEAESAGTSWGIYGASTQCVECMAGNGAATSSRVRRDVGAHQRPNLGAKKRGRASVSSSADHGGAPRGLATAGPTEALLDSGARPRYSAMGIDPRADGVHQPLRGRQLAGPPAARSRAFHLAPITTP